MQSEPPDLLTPNVNHFCRFICHTYFHCIEFVCKVLSRADQKLLLDSSGALRTALLHLTGSRLHVNNAGPWNAIIHLGSHGTEGLVLVLTTTLTLALTSFSGRLRQAPDVLYVIRKYAKILQ